MTVFSARCTAMIRANIDDPTSRDGIEFCAGVINGPASQCPYDYCVVIEHRPSAAQMRRADLQDLARTMRDKDITIADIALIINRSIVQTRRYLHR